MAYVTDKYGNTTQQISSGNTVAKDSVFDPQSKNYNASIANSSGVKQLTVADSMPSSWSNAQVKALTGVERASNGGNGTSLSNPNGNAASPYASTVNGHGSTSSSAYANFQPVSVADILSQVQSSKNTASATTPTTSSTNSDLIKQLASQQQTANEAALANARDTSVNANNQQISTLPGQYQPLRDQASFQGAKGVNGINEQSAQQGLFNSGRNMTLQTNNSTNTANNINSLNTQQQSDKDKLTAAIAQAQTDYANGVAQSTATTQSQATQNQINQNNADNQYNLQVAGLLGSLNGQQTVASKQADASIANTNANTIYQNLINQNYPAEQAMRMAQATASLTGTNLQNDYQSLVNAGYPAAQAAQLAQAQASLVSTNLANNNQVVANQYQGQQIQGQLDQSAATLAGTKLANDAQALQNQYAPQIAQGSIDATKLDNAYKTLVNSGYPDTQAASLAATYAQIAQGQAQTAISQQNANTAAYNSTKTSATPSAAEKAANLSSALSDVQNAFDQGMSPTEVRQSILSRSSDYEQVPGVTVAALLARVDQYEKSWGKTDGENNPNPAVPDQTSNAASAWNSLNNMWSK